MIAQQSTAEFTHSEQQNGMHNRNCVKDVPDVKGIATVQVNTKTKLKKLQELYQQGVERLHLLNQHNDQHYSQHLAAKTHLQAQLSHLSTPLSQIHSKTRKGSQTSTAGEDQETRGKLQEYQGRAELNIDSLMQPLRDQKQKQSAGQIQLLHALQQKLAQIQHANQEANAKEILKIQQLKNSLALMPDNPQHTLNLQQTNQPISEPQSKEYTRLTYRIQQLQSQKNQLSQQHQSLSQKIIQTKRSTIHFSNSTQYLKSTQSCCQQILNEQLCSLQYKIQGRRLQYDSNKRYFDKIVRTRKYEDNLSFDQVKEEINYLNDLCQQMIDRKNNFLAPQIKKYKLKKNLIIQQINTIKQAFTLLQNKKKTLELQTKTQTRTFDQLQDQYCALLEKVDDKSFKTHQPFSQENLLRLKDKKSKLTEELKQILAKCQQIKTQIDSDQSLVPSNIIKEVKKKTQRKKQQLHEIDLLTKENTQLEKQNKPLNEEKNKLEWKTKPEIDQMARQEKELKAAKIILEESLKNLKELNDSLSDKICQMQEAEKQRKQQASTESNQQKTDRLLREKQQQQRQQKQEEEKILLNRSNLMEKLRQKPEDEKDDDEESLLQKDKHTKDLRSGTQKESRRQKGKKGRGKGSEGNDSRRDFFVTRENPLESLRRDFPLNRSEEDSKNLSFLQSNPALYMFVFYLTVVMPGLCLGYCL